MKINADEYKPRLDEYLRAKGIDTSGTNIHCIEPGHPDNNPSASITEADRLKCHSCGSNEDIFGCAGILINKPGKDNFKAQLEEVKKTLGESIEKSTPIKKKQPKMVPAKLVPLPRKEALEIYAPAEVLRKAKKLLNKKDNIEIAENGWFPYYNANELIDIMIIRFNHSGGKDILPFAWNGEFLFMSNIPVLLYNRHHLAQSPGKRFIMHEGEKCCDLASEKLPEFIHTTWNGGGKKFKYIQGLDILAGRDGYLLADDDQKMDKMSEEILQHNDQPGQKTMLELKIILEKL